MAWMYILQCADGSLYVGSTLDLSRRIAEHQYGEGSAYTAARLPVALLYCEEFDRVDDAFRREEQIQGWGRAKRLALVAGDLKAVSRLSKKRFT
ncbi:GIY-YIG nuclease family protein [Microbacterium chocolatum]|uniref:GIY-YIG nuclease family protein n=1 Tax=Microbacterium aurantiacum TaxID=162393 RepID=UPI00338D8E52